MDRLLELCDVYEPAEVLIDNDNASKTFVKLLWELTRAKGLSPPPINQYPLMGRDKETRAAAVRGLFLSDSVRVVRAGWNQALHAELLNFPGGDHDDQIDALSLIGRRFPQLASPPRIEKVKPKDPYEGFGQRPDEKGVWWTTRGLDDLFEEHEDGITARDGRLG